MTKRSHSRRPSSRRWYAALQSTGEFARSLEPRRRLVIEPLEQRRLLTVHDLTTSTDYATIQAAVNGANPGDTLLADAGTYAENVTVNKSLIIEGAQHGVDAGTRTGVSESIVTGVGNNGKTPFYIAASNVTIDGFTVEGATDVNQFGAGILEGGGTSGTQILNNIIQDNIIGLSLANASSASPGLVQHNLIQNNNEPGPGSGDGIYSDQFAAGGTLTSVTIDANTFSGNSDAGIDFSSTDATKPATAITVSNNLFDSNARGMLAFNLTASSITSNTFSNSTSNATADIRLFEGVNGLAITNNLLENGAGLAVRISNIGTGSPDATNVSFNDNSVSGYTGAAGAFQVDNYTGTLDASKNWWGDLSGPTIASNVGGLGQRIVDPGNQVTYAPWLIYGTDADPASPGFQLPMTVPVVSQGDVSPAVNDFTLLQNAIGAAAAGQTIDLSGSFDWTTTNAAAAYAASTNTAPTSDIRGIALPDGVNHLTITSSAGNATITGGGDSTDGIYNAFIFSAVSSPAGVGNDNLTISKLNIDNFKSGVMLGWNNGGMFNGTLVQNNTITVAADNDDSASDTQGIAVYFWNGHNQTMSGNTIDFMGNGTRTTGSGARSYGFQDGTTGGTGYDGLSIDHNIFKLLPSAVGGTEVVTGVWDNGHNDDNASHISIADNQFLGIQGGRLFDIGLQLSSQTSNMSIDGNTFTDVKYVYWVGTHNGDAPGDQFTFTNNTLTRVGDSNGVFLQNAIDNTPGDVITIHWATNNTIDGFTGIRGLNELSTQATGTSRPNSAATDLDAVIAFGPIQVDYVNATWGAQGRFTNPLAAPDGTPGPIAFGFNTFNTIQGGVDGINTTPGTVNVLPGTYVENVTIDKDLTLTGPNASPPTVVVAPTAGDGIALASPAANVTVQNLEVTGAANGISTNGVATVTLNNLLLDGNSTGLLASGLTTLNLSDLRLTGNTTAGGTIAGATTVNDTPITGATGATDTITGSTIQRGSDDVINYSGVTNLNVTGSNGADTFNVTPATSTTLSVAGGLPTPPTTPGDTLNVVLTGGATTPALSQTLTASGYQGSWTFGNAMPIHFSEIESVGNNTDLSITKSDNSSTPGSAAPGTSLTYTIVVTNGGANAVIGATVVDTLPADFTGATYTAVASGGATNFTANGSGDIHDTVNMPAGSTITYTVTGTIKASATGTLANTATVAVPASVLDVNTANNSETDIDTVTAQANISISKTDNKGGDSTTSSAGSVAAGAAMTYTIVVSNAGPSDVSGATIADALPASFTGASFTATATGGATGFSANGSGNIQDAVNLPAGSSITYVLTGTVANAATGTLTNTANVTLPAGVVNTGSTSASVTDTITLPAGVGYLAGVPGDSTAQTFVQNLYRELLGREPDATGEAFWIAQVQQNSTAGGRQAVIAAFLNSPEYKAHYIATLYEVFLGRAPEAAGVEFWTAKMGNPGTPGGHSGGADEKFILAAIVGSDEFYAHAGGTDQAFAQALYQDLLGRSGESAGVSFWANVAHAQPQSRDAIVRLFLSSPEAAHKLLDSFYPAPGGTASNPLPAPGTGVSSADYDLAIVTGLGWENLYLEGPFDNSPEGNDAFFADLASGGSWDDVQFELLASEQFYNNPNRPVTT